MNISKLCEFGALITPDETESTDFKQLFPQVIEGLVRDFPLLVFRGYQAITEEELETVSRQLGPLLEWDFGYVMNLRIEENPRNHIFRSGRLELHWDGSYLGPEKTPRFSLFQCVQGTTNDGGETLFCDSVRAFSSADVEYQLELQDAVISYSTERKAHFGGDLTWPLVCPIRGGNSPVIRYMEAFNEDNQDINPIKVCVEGKDPESSEAFLHKLNRHLYKPEFLYAHKWETSDFLIFRNDALLHGRRAFENNRDPRHIQRVHIL
jgi:alpha-ketoglutarate-dependent taurine dioxygenase